MAVVKSCDSDRLLLFFFLPPNSLSGDQPSSDESIPSHHHFFSNFRLQLQPPIQRGGDHAQ
ncbi:hypothetical protein LINGRAHAP2_LOCUS31957 [Linum grandiflorum]